MRQTVLSVVLDVQPESSKVLVDGIVALRDRLESSGVAYDLLTKQVPSLHFLSMSVFTDGDFDPVFVVEANFDGPPGPFWSQLESTLGPDLRDLLRSCKRPLDNAAELFDAVTATGSCSPIAPYLEMKTVWPAVSHMGNRGLDRDRILDEGALFRATRAALAQPSPNAVSPYHGLSAQALHAKLRTAVQHKAPWLDDPAPARVSKAETASDLTRLFGFALLALLLLSGPGLLLASLATAERSTFVICSAGIVAAGLLYGTREALPGQRAPGLRSTITTKRPLSSAGNPIGIALAATLLLLLFAVALTGINAAAAWLLTGDVGRDLLGRAAITTGLGMLGIAPTGMALLVWVRWLERRDGSHDAPVLNPVRMLAMARLEDRGVQNHMGSMVVIKPGALRAWVVRLGLWGLGLVLKVTARSGYLASMRTIHFAHWALVNNGSRLMFFSNFDGTWESYLDDFIEKANAGLTLAWTNGLGFPPTRFLVMDGASHGRRFKAWARHSMPVTLLWYSAYKDFTVDQIERHARLAAGLRAARLTESEAEAWALDL